MTMSMSTLKDKHQQDRWPVEVFRYSDGKGWELYQQAYTHTSPSPSSSAAAEAAANTGEEDDDDPITVAPRRGCVEVRKLRLRIHIFTAAAGRQTGQSQSQNKNHPSSKKRTSSQALDESHNDQSQPRSQQQMEVHTTVVRRKDTILLSKGGFGAIVFQFKSTADCISFSDRLVELNAEYCLNSNSNSNSSCDYDAAHSKKRKMMMLRGNHHPKDKDHSLDHANRTPSASCTKTNINGPPQEQQQQQQQQQHHRQQHGEENSFAIQSYMVHLLHDRDFLGFVDRVEESLSSNADCMKMLQALEYPRGMGT
mmetsp:Transcript_15297/g.22420  ORF Transcript_15297/g.22420 Transcript_15297/m.22420 type:complete len:310 (-) Transcript_15297:168-1097(-)